MLLVGMSIDFCMGISEWHFPQLIRIGCLRINLKYQSSLITLPSLVFLFAHFINYSSMFPIQLLSPNSSNSVTIPSLLIWWEEWGDDYVSQLCCWGTNYLCNKEAWDSLSWKKKQSSSEPLQCCCVVGYTSTYKLGQVLLAQEIKTESGQSRKELIKISLFWTHHLQHTSVHDSYSICS